jgi:putative transcriptional regulator
MKIMHHPGPESLMSCSAGSMPQAFAAVMAVHIELCPACRMELAWLEHVGAALFETLPPAPISRPAPLMALRAGEAVDDDSNLGSTLTGRVPLLLFRAIGADLDAVPWTHVSLGVRQYQIALEGDDRGDLILAKVDPGQKLPKLNHRSSIIALVLKGSYRDAIGHYQVGDVADLGRDAERSPIADPDHGCVCLIATDDRL